MLFSLWTMNENSLTESGPFSLNGDNFNRQYIEMLTSYVDALFITFLWHSYGCNLHFIDLYGHL